jgi:hypothetical protein
MYESVIASVFNFNIPSKLISKAIKDMNTVEKILRDPYGIKKKLVAAIDHLIYGFPLFSSLIFPLRLKDGLDYLNLGKNEWAMPYDKARKSNLTFIDMFKEACDKTQRFCQVLYSTITEDTPNVSYALKLFGTIPILLELIVTWMLNSSTMILFLINTVFKQPHNHVHSIC